MARPRFLTDQDFNENIIRGVERLEPNVEFLKVREIGLEEASDSEVLEYAAENQWIVLSHDVQTMSKEGIVRINNGQPMTGLLLVHQRSPIGQIIDDLLAIWGASELEEWSNRVFFLPF